MQRIISKRLNISHLAATPWPASLARFGTRGRKACPVHKRGAREADFAQMKQNFAQMGHPPALFVASLSRKSFLTPEEPFSFMQTMKKQEYVSPESRVIELRTEGVIAYSYVNPFEEHEIW